MARQLSQQNCEPAHVTSNAHDQLWRGDDHTIKTLGCLDLVGDVMRMPGYTCGLHRELREVAAAMGKAKTSCLVVLDDGGHIAGVITDRDLIGAMGQGKTEGRQVMDVMASPVLSVSPKDSVFKAMRLLVQYGFRKMPVVHRGELLGMVSLEELMRMDKVQPLALVETIAESRTPSELARVHRILPELAATRLASGIDPHNVICMLSVIHRELYARAIELVMERIQPAPAFFCLFVTGAQGRSEALLSPTQDHGMIIDDGKLDERELSWFLDFSERLVAALEEIGYGQRANYILSTRGAWRKNIADWRNGIDRWFSEEGPELGRNVNMMLDADSLWGRATLFGKIKGHLYHLVGRHKNTLAELYRSEGPTCSSLSEMADHGLEPGVIDIEGEGLRAAVSYVRLLALRHGVREQGTRSRLRILVGRGCIRTEDYERLEDAFLCLQQLSLQAQIRHYQTDGSSSPSTTIADLSRGSRERLEQAMLAIGTMRREMGLGKPTGKG